MAKVNVIRFGAVYCCQDEASLPIIEAVIREAREREFRTRGGALSYVTRRLREAGLRVSTANDRACRDSGQPVRWNDDGGAAA